MENPGKFFVIMGPSGVGKTSLVNALVHDEKCQTVVRIPTYTTRKARVGEINGVDYYFITEAEFREKMVNGDLLEWSHAYQAFYGLGRKNIEDVLASGITALAVVDRVGAVQIRKLKSDVKVIFIVPPSMTELRERLTKRSNDSEQSMLFRLSQAEREAEQERQDPVADLVVINDDFDLALENLKKIICK